MTYAAATRLTPVEVTIAGLALTGALTAVDGTNGNKFECAPGDTFLRVKNGAGADITVTIDTPATFRGLAVADQTVVVVATTGDVLIGPFDAALHFQPGTNDVFVTFSSGTTVTAKVYHAARAA